MVAINIVLMVLVLSLLAGLLAWAIASDRGSKRAAGGVAPSDKPLHHNLLLPREMRGGRTGNLARRDRSRSARG